MLHESALLEASHHCGELDAILALALSAEKYGWNAPQLVQAPVLHIIGGRHPLQELTVQSFVPNDCHIAGGSGQNVADDQTNPQALILTGPNHSGKSVYLKQVAIITFLAHIGSFVPAERATIGVTDKILGRLSTRESVSRSESAFALDLSRVARAMRLTTPQSLLLIDEFGQGTNTDDGCGLLVALLNHVLNSAESMPRFILTTHLHQIFELSNFNVNNLLNLCHMKVLTDWEADQPDEQITYLFKLSAGYSSSSLGEQCAALSGVPSNIVSRASALGALLSQHEDLASACTKLSYQEENDLEEAESVARAFLSVDLGKYGKGVAGISALKTSLGTILSL